MDKRFSDRTVVITGGSEGVGAATARKFAVQGANLVLAARSKRKLEVIAEELRLLTRVEIAAMDVTDFDACANLLKKAQFEFGGVHVLVNNAGFHKRGLVEDVAAEDLARIIDVNLKAPIVLCQMALPYLREVEEATIVNVGSLAGRAPIPGSATYSASKNGLRAFSYALRAELSDSAISVAVVSPGPVDTGFIMSNIDVVSDITFSQPMSSADEVADEILKLVLNRKSERSMPPLSGFLATTLSLFPGLSQIARPLLEKKGRRVKQRLRSRRQESAEDQGV